MQSFRCYKIRNRFYICLKLTSKKLRYSKLGRIILETNSTYRPTVGTAVATNRKVAGLIPAGVIGIFH